ncbi:unannotated protein [freshwater metagenome]|uniref:Unannotated protein n=1 Tax=freshwater metagenome TaxID=449393 RepID=A0A6J7EY86_9ZZZZ|nr:ATP-binding cassette domain-containing protein [Actinomycetota bacterium]
MSSDAPAIRIRGLGKRYRIAHRDAQHITLAETMLQRLRHPMSRGQREDFWALRDIDLDIARGEALGILGRNGAGKSTLLKVLSRITHPTTGEVDLYGRVGGLLEVGTGFHPELTGRENVYLNGSILGMRTREIDQRFDEIVDFAGAERFLDTPLKRFSSGMQVRLAFSVAAFLDTEILIIDEVLAVGDADFQAKCLGKMGDLLNGGRTVLFVSHNASAVAQLTQRCVLLDAGRLVADGPTADVLAEYSKARERLNDVSTWDLPRPESHLGTIVKLARVRVGDSSGVIPQTTQSNVQLEVVRTGSFDGDALRVVYRILRHDGIPVGTAITSGVVLPAGQRSVLDFELASADLAPGHYYLAIWIDAGLEGVVIPLDHLPVTAHFQVVPDAASPFAHVWANDWGVTTLPSSTLSACSAKDPAVGQHATQPDGQHGERC